VQEFSSPSVRKNLFRGSTPQSLEPLDTLSILRNELEEKERLITKLREDLSNAKTLSKNVEPENWASSTDM
jgi:hypothetical protein